MRSTFALLCLLFLGGSASAVPSHTAGGDAPDHPSTVGEAVSHDDNAGFPKLPKTKQTRLSFEAGKGDPIVSSVPSEKPALERGLNEYVDKKYSTSRCKVVPSTGLFGAPPFYTAYYTLACGDRRAPNQESAPIIVGVNSQTGRLTDLTLRGIPKTLDATSPKVTPEDALRVGREAFETRLNQTVKTVKGPKLKVLVDSQGNGRLAWVVTFSNGQRGRGMLAGEFWIRATGEPTVLALKQHRPFH